MPMENQLAHIMCPTIMNWVKSYQKKESICALCVACVMSGTGMKVFLLYIGTRYGLDDLSYSFPFARIFNVIFGMLICRLLDVNQASEKAEKDLLMEIFIAVAAIGWFIGRNSCSLPIFIIVFFDFIICGMLIYIYAQEKSYLSHWLSLSRLAQWGGSMMYVYLFHYPVVIYIDCVFQKHRYVIGDFTGVFEVAVIILLTFFAVKCAKRVNEIWLNISGKKKQVICK